MIMHHIIAFVERLTMDSTNAQHVLLLLIPHVCINLSLLNQLLMLALLHNLSTNEHQYLVSISRSGESVSHYYAGSAFANLSQRFLNDSLCCRVESAGCFIEKEKLWISEKCSC